MARSLYARLDQRFGTQPAAIERQRDVQSRMANLAVRVDTDILLARPRAKKKARVVVVGAGFAGLMAGSALSPSCNVSVFEARDRVGGRVWTQIDIARHRAIEAGAELIGYNHPKWLTLARKFDLGLTVLTTEEAFTSLDLEMPFSLNGQLLSSKQAEKIYREMGEAIAGLCAEAGKISDPYKCWETPQAGQWDSMSLGDWVSTLGCSPVAKRAIEAQFENTNGAPVHKQSFLANLAAIRGGALHGKPDDYFTQSETVKCEQGNQMLATRLAEEIVHAGGVVATSTPISSIKLDRDKVTVTSASGVVTEADYVVLAIPPSLWPSGGPSDIRIDPPIPPEFHMSMGLAVKYLSAVKTRFWFGAGLSPNAVSDTIGVTWDGTDNQLQLNGEPVELSLFAGGPAAASAIDLLKRAGPEGLDAFYAREIGKLYGGYAGNRASAQFVCWPQERWTRAGYSCPAPGEATRIGPFLNQPFHDRLFFAGEHCCLPFFGYMEGALQSGEATAFAIARSERLA